MNVDERSSTPMTEQVVAMRAEAPAQRQRNRPWGLRAGEPDGRTLLPTPPDVENRQQPLRESLPLQLPATASVPSGQMAPVKSTLSSSICDSSRMAHVRSASTKRV